MANNDYIFIPDWMSDALACGGIWDNYDDCIADFEKACGKEHVYEYEGAQIAMTDSALIGIYNNNWEEEHIDNLCRESEGGQVIYQPAICNPTNYIKTLPHASIKKFVNFLEDFMIYGGLVILDGDYVLNHDELLNAVKTLTKIHVGYLYISESFLHNFKWTDANTLEWLIQDYRNNLNIVYKGKGYFDTSIYSRKKVLETEYDTEQKVREFNHDKQGNLDEDLLMVWDVTDYVFLKKSGNEPFVNYSIKKKVIQEYMERGGLIHYKGICYSDFDEFLEKNKYDNN